MANDIHSHPATKGRWAHLRRAMAGVLWLGVLTGCGGGSSTGGTAAPANLSYPNPPALTVGVAMTALTPTVTGTVTSYSVNPGLPAGLNLNTTSGVISGTPTTAAAMSSYTVTAANSAGSATASVSLEVDTPTAAPVISYASPAYSFTTGVAAATINPTSSGGAVTTWSISPALPMGITFNATDGSISGTPSQSAVSTTYTVTATNGGGQGTFALTIAVASAPLLDLGHVQNITVLQLNATYALSADLSGHWNLWNFATGAQLASGTAACIPNLLAGTCNQAPISLGGATLLIGTPTGLELRAAPGGQVTAQIAVDHTWVTLASDGSYACAGGATGLRCWSATGQQLFSATGDYSVSKVYAAPGQLQVALGAKGANLIETIATAGWTSSVGPAFTGNFHSWFVDGASFITTSTGNTVRIYSNAGAPLDQRSLPDITNLTGQGSWFWTFGIVNLNNVQQPLNIYKVGNSTVPTATYSFYESSPVFASGPAIGVFVGDTPGAIGVIDLSGATPAEVTYNLPLIGSGPFAATAASRWLMGNGAGVVFDGSGLPATGRFFNYGKVWHVVGGGSRVALSTASGRVISYDTTNNTLEQTIDQPDAELAMSTDGTVLAAAAYHFNYQTDLPHDRSAYVYSMPSGTLINTFPFSYTYGVTAPVLNEMSLSGDGTTIGLVSTPTLSNTTTVQALKVQNGTQTFSATSATWGGPLRLSPDATLVAFTNLTPDHGTPTVSTSIYQNGTLATALSGWSVGWLDNARLLVNNTTVGGNSVTNYTYLGAALYGPTGTLLSSPALPEVTALQPLGGDLIYASNRNQILSVQTGKPLWQSADATSELGAVTADEVVFVSGNLVLAQPYSTH